MNPITQEKGELLISSRDTMKKASLFNFSQMHLLGGMLYMTAGVPADKEKYKRCRDILRSKTGILSNMRGIIEMAVVAKMSVQPDPEAYISKVLQAYDALTAGRMFKSEYLVFTAMAIAEGTSPEYYERVATNTWRVYGMMREEHPLLTGQNDTTFIAMLIMNTKDIGAIMEEMTRCYDIISQQGFFLAKDTAQAAAQILALSPKPASEKCARYKDLQARLKAAKCNLRNGPEQAILAAFADVEASNEQLVGEIVEVERWLKTQRGMGIFGAGAQLRRVMACVIVLEAHKDDRAPNTAAASSAALTSSIVTQIVITIIILIMIVAINATVHASSN